MEEPQEPREPDRTSLEHSALRAAKSGDAQAVGAVLESMRTRIENALRLRIDPRIAGRVSASDVYQDALVEVTERLPEYLRAPTEAGEGGRGRMPFFLWVRFLALQKLTLLHRTHLNVAARDAGREVGAADLRGSEASAAVLASALALSGATPSRWAEHDERKQLVLNALETLEPTDREVLVLRHFEHMPNNEIAALLDITPGGASLRHLGALKRLRDALARVGITLSTAGLT